MTRLQDLYDIGGQSPWLDNLRRDWLEGGQLAELVALGRARHHLEPDHLRQRHQRAGHLRRPVPRAHEGPHGRERLLGDGHHRHPRRARTCCGPLYDESDGEDGFVSLEVSPAPGPRHRGHRARRPRCCTSASPSPTSSSRCRRPGRACRPSRPLIGEGRSINVTLIFGLDRYDEVMEAYLRGLEALVAAGREAELPRVASVASFFVSRVDTEVDRRLETLAGGERATPPSSACGARPRWPRPRRPTSTSTAPSPATAGRRCGRRAPGCSGRCGPPPRPRTRPTPTCSTSTT